MFKLILSISITMLSGYSYAESPVQFSAQDSQQWNSSMSSKSLSVLQTWFENNNSLSQFGGTRDGVCESVYTSGDALVVSSAYNYHGTYAILREGIEGFTKITDALVNKHDDTILYLLTENPTDTIFCIKNR